MHCRCQQRISRGAQGAEAVDWGLLACQPAQGWLRTCLGMKEPHHPQTSMGTAGRGRADGVLGGWQGGAHGQPTAGYVATPPSTAAALSWKDSSQAGARCWPGRDPTVSNAPHKGGPARAGDLRRGRAGGGQRGAAAGGAALRVHCSQHSAAVGCHQQPAMHIPAHSSASAQLPLDVLRLAAALSSLPSPCCAAAAHQILGPVEEQAAVGVQVGLAKAEDRDQRRAGLQRQPACGFRRGGGGGCGRWGGRCVVAVVGGPTGKRGHGGRDSKAWALFRLRASENAAGRVWTRAAKRPWRRQQCSPPRQKTVTALTSQSRDACSGTQPPAPAACRCTP